MCHDFQQNVLGCVLRVMEGTQHPQGEVEYQILHPCQHRLQRGLVSGGGFSD